MRKQELSLNPLTDLELSPAHEDNLNQFDGNEDIKNDAEVMQEGKVSSRVYVGFLQRHFHKGLVSHAGGYLYHQFIYLHAVLYFYFILPFFNLSKYTIYLKIMPKLMVTNFLFLVDLADWLGENWKWI